MFRYSMNEDRKKLLENHLPERIPSPPRGPFEDTDAFRVIMLVLLVVSYLILWIHPQSF